MEISTNNSSCPQEGGGGSCLLDIVSSVVAASKSTFTIRGSNIVDKPRYKTKQNVKLSEYHFFIGLFIHSFLSRIFHRDNKSLS